MPAVDVLNLHDLELLAKSRLPQLAWDYYASGADDERCVRRNTLRRCGPSAVDVLVRYRVFARNTRES